jgi:DNA-binding XRE family transcriptional regulator
MEFNWLWDSRLSQKEVAGILKDETNPRFDLYAEKLLSRLNRPREVFRLLNQETFCRKWPTIKRRMVRDRWLTHRVVFWQTLYEVVKDRLKEQGVHLRPRVGESIPLQRRVISEQIRKIRMEKGYHQKDLAARLGVIQQYISRLESGRENFSVDVLSRIAEALGKELQVKLK